MTQLAAVACGNPDTARAAAAILQGGGNAVDAAIAAGFMAALAEPGLTSLGGGGFLLVRQPGGEQHLLDFFVNAPGAGLDSAELTPHFTPVNINFTGADQVFYSGYGSVAVPGVLDGYLAAHRRFGRLSLPEVLSPAQAAADEGVRLAPAQAEVLGLLRDIFTLTPDAQEVYAPGGQLPTVGGLLRNAQYSEFLGSLATSRSSGWGDRPEADALASVMKDNHGLLTTADLTAYAVVDRAPLTAHYRESHLTTNPAPSFGGSIVVAALGELETSGGAADSCQRVLALKQATETAKLARHPPRSSKGTTHISVVDGAGMLVSMTTSNGSCSGVMAGGSGIQLNNMMGEADLHPDGFHAIEPGVRIGSMMAPMLLDLPGGTVVSLGSGGSERIRSALTQVVSRLVEHDAEGTVGLDEAIQAPRAHLDAGVLQVEPGLAEPELAALTATGPVNQWSRPDLYFGGVHAVSWHPNGTVEAAGDPRRDGVGLVVPL